MVGRILSDHFANGFDRAALAGSGHFDPNMTLAPAGLGY
jgi:hypothetical protein